jgi:DNA-binding NtrC family response regulator
MIASAATIFSPSAASSRDKASDLVVTRILLIDDDVALSGFLRSALEASGQQVDHLESAQGALEFLAQTDYDVILLDNRMPGLSGIELLAGLQARGISVPVILMTGDPRSDTAIQATNLGAFDYVVKPLELDELVNELEPLIAKAVQIVQSTKEHVRLPGDSDTGSGPQLLGNSRPMQELYKLIGKVTSSADAILILGETGTGKELVARAVHANSPRKQKPFVTLNCSNLVEDDLFGHEAGALPGADKLRKGWFEYANGGTLFLDEISDLSLGLQAKLLPILKTKEVMRAGGREPIPVDVRVVSATSRDLQEAIREGQFREELYYRLNAVAIRLPPLRERGSDLDLLVEHFLSNLARSTGRPIPTLDSTVWDKLRSHHWPGNIWELQNVLGRALLVAQRAQVTAADIELEVPQSVEGELLAPIQRAVTAAVKSGKSNLLVLLRRMLYQELLVAALTESGGDQNKAERLLGVSLNMLMEDAGSPDRGVSPPKDTLLSFRAKALVLVLEHPEWTNKEFAQALGCSVATLYRDPHVGKALKGRKLGGSPPPRGYKTSSGDLDAEDD